MGNETNVHAGRAIPAHHNLQGDLLYPGGAATNPEEEGLNQGDDPDIEKGRQAPVDECKQTPRQRAPEFDVFAPGAPATTLLHKMGAIFKSIYVVALLLIVDASTLAVCWSTVSAGLATVMVYLQNHGVDRGPLVAIIVPFIFASAILAKCMLVPWVKFNTMVWRGKALWSKPSAPGSSLRVRWLGESLLASAVVWHLQICLLRVG